MAATFAQAVECVSEWCRARGLDATSDGSNISWDYQVADTDARTAFCSVVPDEMGPGVISISVVSGFAFPFPSERYWDTLEFINRINADNETGIYYVIGSAEGQFGLLAKALWVGDVVTGTTVGYLCSAVAMEMKNILPSASSLWDGGCSVAAALEEYWA